MWAIDPDCQKERFIAGSLELLDRPVHHFVVAHFLKGFTGAAPIELSLATTRQDVRHARHWQLEIERRKEIIPSSGREKPFPIEIASLIRMIDLPTSQRNVAVLFEKFGEQENVIESVIRQPVVTVAINARRRGMEARHDGGARRIARGGIAVGVAEQYPFGRQRVEAGCIHIERLAVHLSRPPVIEVINSYEEDIRSAINAEAHPQKR